MTAALFGDPTLRLVRLYDLRGGESIETVPADVTTKAAEMAEAEGMAVETVFFVPSLRRRAACWIAQFGPKRD